jgi:hypothetical protein
VLCVNEETLSMIFATAVLLTGSTERAETAVLEGIQAMDVNARTDGELLRRTVTAAVQAEQFDGGQRLADVAGAMLLLPPELQEVLHLPGALRQCFVVRVLLGMPRERCAALFGTDTKDVDENTRAAAVRLSQRSGKRGEGELTTFSSVVASPWAEYAWAARD